MTDETFNGMDVPTKIILAIFILVIMIFVICGGCNGYHAGEANRVEKFYVAECRGGYCVYVYAYSDDAVVTGPLTIEQATEIQKKLQQDVGNNFASKENK